MQSFLGHCDLVFDVAGLVGLVAFLGWEGVLRRFLDAVALPVSPPGQEVADDVLDGLASRQGEACGAGAGVISGDPDGHGEGDPVWVDPDGAGRFGLEGA